MALDLGRARIGVALGDTDTASSWPLEVVARKGTRKDIAALQRLLAGRDVRVFVVGLPTSTDGADDMHRLARAFAQRLAEAQDLPVFLVDEAGTTGLAQQELRGLGLRNARRRKVVDKVAAARILDRWFADAPAIAVEP